MAEVSLCRQAQGNFWICEANEGIQPSQQAKLYRVTHNLVLQSNGKRWTENEMDLRGDDLRIGRCGLLSSGSWICRYGKGKVNSDPRNKHTVFK